MLINCPECGKEISDKAEKCIHCGYPLHKSTFYKIKLISCGEPGVEIMNVYSAICDVLLFTEAMRAIEFSENVPCVLVKGVDMDDARFIEEKFTSLGATVEIEEDTESLVKNDIRRKMEEHQQEKQRRRLQMQMKTQASQTRNVPKCPTCGSTNIRRITSLNSGLSIAMLGIYSSKINKTFECRNCKYTW